MVIIWFPVRENLALNLGGYDYDQLVRNTCVKVDLTFCCSEWIRNTVKLGVKWLRFWRLRKIEKTTVIIYQVALVVFFSIIKN